MRRTVFFGVLFVAVVFSVLLLRRPAAEVIPHHGNDVESEGRAEDCLMCHDGFVASSASPCTVQCDFRGSHSILKFYPPAGKELLYAPLDSLLAMGMKLENGKVTCISCHNLHNPGRYHLWIDNSESRLCSTCHLVQGR